MINLQRRVVDHLLDLYLLVNSHFDEEEEVEGGGKDLWNLYHSATCATDSKFEGGLDLPVYCTKPNLDDTSLVSLWVP
jgi:hypothetical protein